MGINYKGSQGQTERAIALQEDEEEEDVIMQTPISCAAQTNNSKVPV
jgi:hypothetical protein